MLGCGRAGFPTIGRAGCPIRAAHFGPAGLWMRAQRGWMAGLYLGADMNSCGTVEGGCCLLYTSPSPRD
eukprot:7973850-Alexandrium_andersonii.AAC.1